ncbi:MAG: hypothetical protein K6G27_08145 [Lachnospiraceae bacterium]|nr:hypothetical protein [Lachnospiraceae bacterium]
MENKLRNLFDYQRFEQNDNLKKLIDDTHRRMRITVIPDDLLRNISAAGDTSTNIELIKELNKQQ